MNRILGFLTGRLGVLGTWGSVGRVAAWTVLWAVVVGLVVAPAPPTPQDRERAADVPESNVRYLGPVIKGDFAGFIRPENGDEGDDDVFTVAWIGGSEVKLREVSVAGEVGNRIAAFGDQRVQIDAYTLLAPRPLDALRAVDAARSNGADAIVLSINATWLTDEWSMREWQNLDIANIGTLLDRPSTWPWAAALTSPADVSWRITRAVSPIVEAQQRLNRRAQDAVDRLDVIDRPETSDAEPADLDPRLPASTESFWLVAEYGPQVLDDTTKRVATQVDGLADDSPVADALNLRLVDDIAAADVPAYLYVAPFSPEALADPDLAAAVEQVEAYWTTIASKVASPLVTIEPSQLTPRFADRAVYFDLVHMADAAPFAEVLVTELCANWRTAHPDRSCS